MGSRYGEDTRNVLVEDSHAECGSNGGVVIVGAQCSTGGCEPNQNVHGVVFRNLTSNRTNQGLPHQTVTCYVQAVLCPTTSP